MILETGKHALPQGAFSPVHRALRRAAFTIIEVVLVLALMAVAASVVIANFVAFAERSGQPSAEETLHAAIRAARFQAASTRRTTELRFDKESASLLVDSGKDFPLGSDFGENEAGGIRFFLVAPVKGLASFPESSESRLETASVRFAPDRSSTPFVAEIDSGRGTPRRLVFDPFSSLVRNTE